MVIISLPYKWEPKPHGNIKYKYLMKVGGLLEVVSPYVAFIKYNTTLLFKLHSNR